MVNFCIHFLVYFSRRLSSLGKMLVTDYIHPLNHFKVDWWVFCLWQLSVLGRVCSKWAHEVDVAVRQGLACWRCSALNKIFHAIFSLVKECAEGGHGWNTGLWAAAYFSLHHVCFIPQFAGVPWVLSIDVMRVFFFIIIISKKHSSCGEDLNSDQWKCSQTLC